MGILLNTIGLLVVVVIFRCIYTTIYNIFFHPLRQYPGPLSRRASHIPFHVSAHSGHAAQDVHKLHERYGPVVRIAPDELSFLSHGIQAWTDIYNRKPQLEKTDIFYRQANTPLSIIGEYAPQHSVIRKQLSSGFSDRAIKAQEPTFAAYVDLLITQLTARCGGDNEVDMSSWYNWTTFDIIGDLSMGEPFGSLERGQEDPWITSILQLMTKQPLMITMKWLGLDALMAKLASRSPALAWLEEQTTRKLERRVNLGAARHDLIEGLLAQPDDKRLDFAHIQKNSLILLIGGSETSATVLSGVTYLLLQNPAILQRVVDEVRTAFESEKDISLISVTGLTYMLACLNEAMRVYPPVPLGLPRMVPKGGVTVDGHFVPEGTTVSVWHWVNSHSSINFKEPFTFKPERWLDEGKDEYDRLDAVQPFSLGPRNCIGQTVAIAEMRLILARILYNFDIKLSEKSNDWLNHPHNNLWEKPPLYVQLARRGIA